MSPEVTNHPPHRAKSTLRNMHHDDLVEYAYDRQEAARNHWDGPSDDAADAQQSPRLIEAFPAD